MANSFSGFLKQIIKIFTPKATTPKATTTAPKVEQPKPPTIETIKKQTEQFIPKEERVAFIPTDDKIPQVEYDIDDEDEEVTLLEKARAYMENFFNELASNGRQHLANSYQGMWYDAIDYRGEETVARSITTASNWGDTTQVLIYESEGTPKFIRAEHELHYILYDRAMSMDEQIKWADQNSDDPTAD